MSTYFRHIRTSIINPLACLCCSNKRMASGRSRQATYRELNGHHMRHPAFIEMGV